MTSTAMKCSIFKIDIDINFMISPCLTRDILLFTSGH